MARFNFSIFTMALILKFCKRNRRHLCLLNDQESESNTYIPPSKMYYILLTNSNHQMTLFGILNHITLIWNKKRPQIFWIFLCVKKFGHSFLLWAVWSYLLRYSQTYFDYLWHVFKLTDMFLMSRILRIIFSYHINFSLV